MLTRRRFLQMVVASGPLGLVGCKLTGRATPPEMLPPNIILLLADDMGLGDTSVYQDFTQLEASQQVLTPNMQRFANHGVRFTDAYSAGPVCAPSRRGILMGEYSRRQLGAAVTLPQALKRGNYRAYGVGKWHQPFNYGATCQGNVPISLGPFSFGFDHYAGTRHNVRISGAYFVDRTVMKYDEKSKTLRPNDSDNEPGYDRPGGPREQISQQIWLDYARRWMSGHVDGGEHADRPFFLYYASHANHVHHRPAEDLDGIQVVNAARTADGRPLAEDRDDLVRVRSEMIYENDVALGILLDWLEKHDDPRNPGQKLIDNTFLVFTSDNGAEVPPGSPAQGRFRGRKTNAWEAGSRVPFIARWGNRFPAGSTSSEIISGVDFYATFAATADVELRPDEALDSFNIIAAMLRPDSKEQVRGAGIHTGFAYLRTTRIGDFKAIAGEDGAISEIYDLGNDIGETKNLKGMPEYAEQEAALSEFLAKSRKDGRTRLVGN